MKNKKKITKKNDEIKNTHTIVKSFYFHEEY